MPTALATAAQNPSRFLVIEWPEDHEENLQEHAADIQEMLDGAQVGGATVHHDLAQPLIAALERAFAEFDETVEATEAAQADSTTVIDIHEAQSNGMLCLADGLSGEAWIALSGPVDIADSTGRVWHVRRMYLEQEGYIPDLYIQLDSDQVCEHQLYDDGAFHKGVFEVLAGIGYTGRSFYRAELGMQGDGLVVLEPNNDFTEWAISKGYKLLD